MVSLSLDNIEHKNEFFVSENTGKFLLRDLAVLTNNIYCISQLGALVNRLPVMMTPIGWREFPNFSFHKSNP